MESLWSLIPDWRGWHRMILEERLILLRWARFPGLPLSNVRVVRGGPARGGVSDFGVREIMAAGPSLKAPKCIVSTWLKQFFI